MKPKQCSCGSVTFTIGQAETQVGRIIYPHVCVRCDAVFATYQATKEEVAAYREKWGEPERVSTRTERKRAEGVEYQVSRTAGKACEVCGSTSSIHEHHWAPFHLFGDEAGKWPTSFLCQSCHARWHSVVTPGMGKRKA